MHGVLRGQPSVASEVTAHSVSDSSGANASSTFTAQTDSESAAWFARSARQLLGSDAGLALHLKTGAPERTCYRYTKGERPPTEYMVRQLVHGADGWRWLAAFMEGCDAVWWVEMQRAVHIGHAVIEITKRK